MIAAALVVATWMSTQTAPPPPTTAPTAPTETPPPTDELPATRFIYLPGKFEGICPTEVEVQEGIARRIGRSPFAEPPTRIVVLALEGDGEAPTRARTELFDPSFSS